MWPSYLNLGVDDRNQFDMFRALPGGRGLDGVARFVAALRARGVSVLFPYLAWDGDASWGLLRVLFVGRKCRHWSGPWRGCASRP